MNTSNNNSYRSYHLNNSTTPNNIHENPIVEKTHNALENRELDEKSSHLIDLTNEETLKNPKNLSKFFPVQNPTPLLKQRDVKPILQNKILSVIDLLKSQNDHTDPLSSVTHEISLIAPDNEIDSSSMEAEKQVSNTSALNEVEPIKPSDLECPLAESLKNLPPEDLNNLALKKYLKMYQMRAVAQMRRMKHGYILAFTMGLGKTLTLAAQCIELFKKNPKPILVIVTKSTRIQTELAFKEAFALNAVDEIEERIINPQKMQSREDAYFLDKQLERLKESIRNPEHQKYVEKSITSFRAMHPLCKFGSLVSQKKYKDNFSYQFLSFKIFNTNTQDFLPGDIQTKPKVLFVQLSEFPKKFEDLSKIEWGGIIVDEAQKINNSQGRSHDYVKKLQSISKAPIFFATGTPIENSLRDINTFLSLIESQIDRQGQKINKINDITERLHKKIIFNAQLIKNYLNGYEIEMPLIYQNLRHLFLLMEGYQSIINKISVKRSLEDPLVKEEWENKIPKSSIQKHPLSLDKFPSQKTAIERLKSVYSEDERKGTFFGYMKAAARALIHPNLNTTNQQYIKDWNNESSYLDYFAADQEFIASMPDGVVIFVDQIICGETIRQCLMQTHHIPKIDFLTGNSSVESRALMIENFEKPLDGKPRVFILMIGAGGTGINLQKNGKTAIMAAKKFNPQSDAQAIGRILRAGSDKGTIKVIDLNAKSDSEKHIRSLQKKKLELEKCLFPKSPLKQIPNKKQQNDQCIQAFETILETVIMHLSKKVRDECKGSIGYLKLKLIESAKNDEALLEDALAIDPLQKPPLFLAKKSLKEEIPLELNASKIPENGTKRPRDFKSLENPKSSKALKPEPAQAPMKTLSDMRAFLGKSLTEQKYLDKSYFKVEDASSPLYQKLHPLFGKGFADIIPIQMAPGDCQSNFLLALGVLEKLEQISPSILNEQVIRIRKNADIPMQARLDTDKLIRTEPKLHQWLWKELQEPLIESNLGNIPERFKQARHEIIMVDMKHKTAVPLFQIENPLKKSYLAKFSDGRREHCDILYKNPLA